MPLDLILVSASVFIIIVVFGFAVGGINASDDKKIQRTLAANGPSILTSIGILFTFGGISYSLFVFDPSDIRQSIFSLLDGMKLAFVSSVVGLATALIFRIIRPGFAKQAEEIDVGPEEILAELKNNTRSINELQKSITGESDSSISILLTKMRGENKDANKELVETSKEIKNALTGDGDSSISTQIYKLRQDFQEFAEKMADNNSKSLIQALEEVMKDFNAKINEQFGENFKQLNEAVGQLLDWQKQYKDQVEKITEAFDSSSKGIDGIKDSIKDIEKSAEKIPQSLIKLESIIEESDKRMADLEKTLGTFAEMKQNAQEALPEIEKQIKGMVDAMAKNSQNMMEASNKAIQESDRISSQITENNEKITEMTRASIDKFNTATVEQLNSVLKTMGENLTSITKKIADDYMPFATELNKIRQIVQRNNPTRGD